MLSFFRLDVLDEIWDLTESVSEGFPTYSYIGYSFYLSKADKYDTRVDVIFKFTAYRFLLVLIGV